MSFRASTEKPSPELPVDSKYAPGPAVNRNVRQEGRLYEREIFWREHYFLLKEKGYLLGPRYHPDWIASWKDTDKSFMFCADGQVPMRAGDLMHATRISDGALLKLKKINGAKGQEEIDIHRYLSSESNASQANRCIPLLDCVSLPEDNSTVILVLSFLGRWLEPEFNTVGEAVELFRQLFEGVEFMHKLGIAHNDIKTDNLMMDLNPLCPEPVHPIDLDMKRDYSGQAKKLRSRTCHPVKYYLIDFGNSRQYKPEDGPPLQYVGGGYGGDFSVPEFKTQKHCDPFAVDVYCVGNTIRYNFTHNNIFGWNTRKRNFEFMEPLLRDMCNEDPTKRPTIGEACSRLAEITRGLSTWKLRCRVGMATEPRIVRAILFPGHWARQIGRIIRHVPAIPKV